MSRPLASPREHQPPGPPPLASPFLWPLLAAASTVEATAGYLSGLAHQLIAENGEHHGGAQPSWSTRHDVKLDLQCMRLRDFATATQGVPTLICAPFALHGATVADFAPGHSLVEVLCREGLRRVHVTDWRSATADMRFLSIDSYLAELNVAVDEIGPPVDLIGLCQGGWMALVYAARFPAKVRRLVLAGAPVDLRAGESELSRVAASVPLAMFEEMVRLGDGLVRGDHMLQLWGGSLTAETAARALQAFPEMGAKGAALEDRFGRWFASTVDLPGTFYLQIVSWLFKENRIAEDRFVALGRRVRLADLRAPIFLLAAHGDELVSTAQLFAAARLVGTPVQDIATATTPGSHLGLFMGAETLNRAWPQIARWLGTG